jgi:hypothetical protein
LILSLTKQKIISERKKNQNSIKVI